MIGRYINILKRLFKHNYFFPSKTVSRFKFLFAWEYGLLRFFYFILTRKIKSYENKHEATGEGGVEYSLKAFYDGKIPVYRPEDRTMFPLFLLNSIPFLNKRDLLIIGPRYETEILIAKSFGFKNIKALDTFSYSPLIDVGDMHAMKYLDESFNSIICGWTLTYSDKPTVVAKEIVRVMKKNAILVLAVHKIDKKFDIKKDGIKGQNYGDDRPQNKQNLDKIFESLQNFHYNESQHYVIAAYKKLS